MVEILLRKLPLPMAERFLLQLESDRDDVVEAALAGGTIERYLDQMEAGNTEVREKNSKKTEPWTAIVHKFLKKLNFEIKDKKNVFENFYR